MQNKTRLDSLLIKRQLFNSQSEAQTAIIDGQVIVNEIKITKCGTPIQEDAQIRIKKQGTKFVGRGGEKLLGALTEFELNPIGLIAADIGASTGGFTDCLLQKNCKMVYALDVGYGQLDMKIRQDKRVIPIEKYNARFLKWRNYSKAVEKAISKELKMGKKLEITEPSKVDLIVMDVSFISILKILPALKNILNKGGSIISLVKPQFEAKKDQIDKGGIVTDTNVHQEILEKVIQGSIELGYQYLGQCTSPITGTQGNKEFFIHLKDG